MFEYLWLLFAFMFPTYHLLYSSSQNFKIVTLIFQLIERSIWILNKNVPFIWCKDGLSKEIYYINTKDKLWNNSFSSSSFFFRLWPFSDGSFYKRVKKSMLVNFFNTGLEWFKSYQNWYSVILVVFLSIQNQWILAISQTHFQFIPYKIINFNPYILFRINL